MNNPTILVLGINGMTGKYVYNYLKKNNSKVYGSSRTGDEFRLSANNVTRDLNKIFDKLIKIDFIVNCIGLNEVNQENITEAIKVNSIFPNELTKLSGKFNFKLIHISTDAVFKKMAGIVTENDLPTPDSLYGITKLLGEQNHKNSIIIRTSLIGLNPDKKKGLIEFVLKNNQGIKGYVNQKWSGCTVIQFAKFIEYLTLGNNFNSFRIKSPVFHFAPLGPITKQQLISAIIKESGTKIKLEKISSSVIITRYLDSDQISREIIKSFGTNLNTELSKLFK